MAMICPHLSFYAGLQRRGASRVQAPKLPVLLHQHLRPGHSRAFHCFNAYQHRCLCVHRSSLLPRYTRAGWSRRRASRRRSSALTSVRFSSWAQKGRGGWWGAFLRAYLRGRCVCLDSFKLSGPGQEGRGGGISRTHAHYVCLDPFKPSGPRKEGRGGGISRTYAPARTLFA